jgi:ribonuclease E
MPDGTEQPVVEIPAFPGARPVEWATPIVAETTAEAAAPADEPAGAPAPEPGEDSPTRGPRRRRGSRRKRPDDGAAPEAAPPPYAAPYAGPTPADPFGGGTLDIFDVLEQAEAQHFAASAPQPEPAGGVDETLIEQLSQTPAVLDAEAVAPVVVEPVAGPVIKPVVIGESEPAAEKKRGWWRK